MACQALQDQGMLVIATNWRFGRLGEIDIIAECPDAEGTSSTLVFVEVKTRQGQQFGTATESLSARQQAKLLMLAEAYLSANPTYATHPVRFDLVAIQWDRHHGEHQIKHLENVLSQD